MATYDYNVSAGVIIPDTEAIKDQVESEWRGIFGDEFAVTPDTPQGVMIAGEVTSRQSVARNLAAVANQINPNLAGGIFLDALWALTGGARRPATRSIVTVTLGGIAGTIIPAGSLAQTTDGDQFELTENAIIGSGGTVSATMQSVETGPIPATAGTLTQVATNVLGWETVTNAAGATLGRGEESDQASRLRRRQTLALQGRSTAEAIISQVMGVDGVHSMAFRENTASTAQTIDGIVLVAKSIWCCVDGGVNAEVANAIYEGKSAGAAYNGAVTVNVTDAVSGQTTPVKFDRPTPVAILVRVTIRSTSAVANPAQAIDDAILAYAAGEIDGEEGFTVGGDVSPYELGGAVTRAVPGLFVSLVEVSLASSVSWTTATLSIALNQIATVTADAITTVIS